MKYSSTRIVLCNSATVPNNLKNTKRNKLIKLEYRVSRDTEPNVKILLPNFVCDIYHLPDRILDLLEIAAYVFSADRFVTRGNKDALEYNSWARALHFIIKVRDFNFWRKSTVRRKLSAALCFITGDKEYDFTFQAGHSTPPTSLFDKEEFRIEPNKEPSVVLFSGGLDSLAGIIERLENSKKQVCLISHRSGQPSTAKTQDQLFKALNSEYKNRVRHYKFYCSLKGIRAVEETQRTRSFLYTSIAYALSHALSQNKFYVYENGLTSINFPRRQDLINARASRTTHPKTIALLQEFFSEIEESEIKISTPFLWKTKTDIFRMFADFEKQNLITSAVSCSKTFQNLGQATHCGGCFQCIDRRFAAYGSDLQDIDESGIYALDFIQESIDIPDVKTSLIDYVRQARDFATWNMDHFSNKTLNELLEITDCISGVEDEKKVEKIWDLCCRHGKHIFHAIERMRAIHDDPYSAVPKNSFLDMISYREYLKEPIQRIVETICDKISKAVPIAFQRNKPKNEDDFNDKVSAILNSNKKEVAREHPAILFGLTHVIPDHSWKQYHLLIESKYIRGSTSPSKASEGIAADITKYPEDSYKLFIVYDPNRAISNDEKYKQDFEKKGFCKIHIVR